MRLTRVHVGAPLAGGAVLQLPEDAARHLVRVLRLEAGAPLRAFNGEGGEFDAVIEAVRRDVVTVRIGAHHAVSRESPLRVTLLQGIARGEKMDYILQKATELGVTRVVPVTTVRSTVRLTEQTAARKREHWQAVVTSAAEQCGRDRVPEVAAPMTLAAAAAAVAAELKLLLDPGDSASPLPQLLAGTTRQGERTIALLAGPEGGFDPQEVRTAALAGFQGCRLGPRILRTETAALAALAVLQFAAGDLA
jgi:16S rRNA (uracil1498-N3)-methyltransferase